MHRDRKRPSELFAWLVERVQLLENLEFKPPEIEYLQTDGTSEFNGKPTW